MSDNKKTLAPDSCFPAQVYGLADLIQRDPLVDEVKDLLVAAFDAEADLPAACLPHQPQVFGCHVIGAAKARPGDIELQFDEPLTDFLQAVSEGNEGVILKRKLADAVAMVKFTHLSDHILCRVTMATGTENRTVAKDTLIGTAS